MNNIYDYIIIGSGITASSCAYFLKKHTNSILIIDKNSDVCQGASGAAGAFLSPLLGKDNEFKTLVTKSLKYSTSLYQKDFKEFINNCGTIRIAKNKKDLEKFKEYEDFMDFPYSKKENGYFFEIGSKVNSDAICKKMLEIIDKKLNYEVKNIEYLDKLWYINHKIKSKNLILCTGYENNLLKEDYLKIRAVWGTRIDINSSTNIETNYHKECSISSSSPQGSISIGATHRRLENNIFTNSMINDDIEKLLHLANDIKTLEDVKLLNAKYGARACSFDYFPIVGKVVDSKNTLKLHPHFKYGTHIKDEQLSFYDNLFIINGVGGRGFVLSPYLAKCLVDSIFENKKLESSISSNRLFKRWVKKSK